MAPLDAALDDTALATTPVRSLPDPEPTSPPNDVEGWGARPELRGARGVPTVAVGDNSMPPVTEKMKLPAERYDHLEKENPQLHQIIDKVAGDVGVPAIDLANIAYASSGFKADTPGGYMNVTPQTAQRLDPDGHFNPQDPVDNVYLGAVKYKELADHFGVSTSSALGAYGMNLETIQQMAGLSPEDQRKHFPQVFDYLRRLSSGITTGKPATVVADEPQKQEYQPPLGRPSDEPSQATQDVLRDRPTGDEPPAARGGLTGRWSDQGGPSVALQSQLRSVREQPNPALDLAAVDQANAASRARQPAANAPEMQQAPTDMAQVDAAGAAGARRRENLELLGRVADRSNAPLPPVSEMQNPPTNMALVDQAALRGGPDAAGLEPVRPEFQPPGSQFADPLSGQRVAALPEPTTTIPEMVAAGGRAVADTARSAAAGAGSALAGAYGPTTPSAARYQPPATPPAGDPFGGRDQSDRGPVDPAAGAALTAALPGSPLPPPERSRADTLPFAPTTGSGAPPAAALAGAPAGAPAAPPAAGSSTPPPAPPPGPTPAPGAPAGAPAAAPAPGQPGQPNAAQLNADELARIRAGQPPGPAGMPIPNVQTSSGAVAQPVGQGAGPAAPAVGPGRAAGEPPPVTGGANFSMPGLVRAGMQGGPQGFMSNMVATAPRGMSTNDMWASVGSHLENMAILKGDMLGAQRAREYVFQMQHAGSNQAMMQAYGALAVGDAVGAANLLAKAHAFVPDGSTMAFKVGPPDPRTGQPTLWGQRFVDATGQPVGGPLQVTPQGIAGMLNQTMDPQQFYKTLLSERQLMQKVGHDQLMAGVRKEGIVSTAETADLNRAERGREANQAQQAATGRTQAQIDAANQRAEEANQRMRDIAAAKRGEVAGATRRALTKEADNYWNPNTNPQDFVGGDMGGGTPATPSQLSQAQDLHVGMRTATPDLQPKSAADFTKNILNGSWSVRPTADGRLAVLDKPNNSGNVRAYLPGSMAQVFGRSAGEAPTSVTPQPRVPAQPQQAPAR